MVAKKENDPDILQLQDELDTEWVRSWRMKTSNEKQTAEEFTIAVIPKEEVLHKQIVHENHTRHHSEF